MKTRLAVFLSLGCFIALPAWLTQAQKETRTTNKLPHKYQAALKKGLDYLIRHQHKDGHWEGDDGKHPVAMTGLVGLAVLMESTHEKIRCDNLAIECEVNNEDNIRRAIDWLISHSQPSGLIFSGHPSETSCYMEGHGSATIFLSEALRVVMERKRSQQQSDVLARAVDYIVKASSSQGGWYHTSRREGHDLDTVLATGIQLQALLAAENAYIPIPGTVINDAKEYLKLALRTNDEARKSQAVRATEAAVALACRCDVRQKRLESLRQWARYLSANTAAQLDRDPLAHYYYAQALFVMYLDALKEDDDDGDDTWSNYRTPLFERLHASQNEDGSWPVAAASEGGIGQLHATALWCITLQLDNCTHPSLRNDRVFVD